MSNLYQLTQQIHQLVKDKAEKYGVKIEIEGDENWLFHRVDKTVFLSNYVDLVTNKTYDILTAIQPPQIRQILVAFQDFLGENSEIKELQRELENHKKIRGKNTLPNHQLELMWQTNYLRKNKPLQSQALCQKWLDGLDPLFDRKPEMVLEELLETLTSI